MHKHNRQYRVLQPRSWIKVVIIVSYPAPDAETALWEVAPTLLVMLLPIPASFVVEYLCVVSGIPKRSMCVAGDSNLDSLLVTGGALGRCSDSAG